MLFAALTSAYVVRRGISTDWVRLPLPALLYASLAPIVGTTAVLGVARHRSSVAGFLFAGVALGRARLRFTDIGLALYRRYRSGDGVFSRDQRGIPGIRDGRSGWASPFDLAGADPR